MRNSSSKAAITRLRHQSRVFDLALHEHGELVATQPRDGVASADAAEDPFGDVHQQGVARGVAEVVVDELEVVEVQATAPPLVGSLDDAAAWRASGGR